MFVLVHLFDLAAHVLVPELVVLAEGEVLRRADEVVARILAQVITFVFVTGMRKKRLITGYLSKKYLLRACDISLVVKGSDSYSRHIF